MLVLFDHEASLRIRADLRGSVNLDSAVHHVPFECGSLAEIIGRGTLIAHAAACARHRRAVHAGRELVRLRCRARRASGRALLRPGTGRLAGPAQTRGDVRLPGGGGCPRALSRRSRPKSPRPWAQVDRPPRGLYATRTTDPRNVTWTARCCPGRSRWSGWAPPSCLCRTWHRRSCFTAIRWAGGHGNRRDSRQPVRLPPARAASITAWRCCRSSCGSGCCLVRRRRSARWALRSPTIGSRATRRGFGGARGQAHPDAGGTFAGVDYSLHLLDPEGNCIQLYCAMACVGADGSRRGRAAGVPAEPADWPETIEPDADTFAGPTLHGPYA